MNPKLTGIALAISMTWALAQTTRVHVPEFEAASVRVNHTNNGTIRSIEPDRLTYRDITLGEFIEMAYGVRHYQISGPSWIVDYGSPENYDIVAKAASPVSSQELQRMLAPLLAARFHLLLHRETRELSVYALVTGPKGPKFKAGDGGTTHIRGDGAGGGIFENYSMDDLAASLSLYRSVGRPVVNHTGLGGGYNLRLNLQDLPAGMNPADIKGAVTDNIEPLFTALEDQAGLKLTPEKAQTEFLVVDHAEKVPTEN